MLFSTTKHALVLTILATVVAAAGPARAGIDVDFGANVRLNDSTDLFFSVSSRYFDRDRRTVDSWSQRFMDPDDLSVFLHLCKVSGKSPDLIFSLRRGGMSWWDLGVRVGVPVDTWFVPVAVDPGPPYGRAYGHWKKHRRDPQARIVLTDVDARNLVAARMLHEYYGIPYEEAMRRRASGGSVRVLVADEYRGRHGKPHDDRDEERDRGREKNGSGSKGGGKGHGQGKGKH